MKKMPLDRYFALYLIAIMRRLRIILLLILLCTRLLLLAQAPNPVILKVFELPDPRHTDAYSKANLAVVQAFREKYPHIELRAFSGIRIEGMEMDSSPLLAMAGGVAPDVVYVNYRQSDTYIQKNLLYPLDEFIALEPPELLDWRVEKPVWQVIKRRKKGETEEKTWALPYETLVRVLMYRKDLFRKVGLDPNIPPANWDEFKAYAHKLSDPVNGVFGTMFAIGTQSAYDWLPLLWAAGGDAVIYNAEKDRWEATFASEAGYQAMDFYLKMASEEWTDARGKKQRGYAMRDGDWGQMWSDGKIGMRNDYLSQQNMGGRYDPNLYGFAPSPAGPSGRGGSEINSRMMGIFSGAGISNNGGLPDRDPVQVRQAAWEYIKFFDSEEARQIRLKVMIESGYGRMQNPVFLKRYGYEDYLKYAPVGWLETFETAMREGKPEPYGDNCQKIYEYMTYPLEQLIGLQNAGKMPKYPAERKALIMRVLSQAQERTNMEMIGTLTPQEELKRERVAAIFAALILFVFGFSIWRVFRILSPQLKVPRRLSGSAQAWIVLLLAPAVISIFMWKYMPLISGSVMAVQDFHLVGHSPYIGLKNLAELIYDASWWASVLRTLYYMALSLGLGFFSPIILAILLQEVSRGKMLYRVIYYLPAVISGVIVIYLWKLLYNPSDSGALNQILSFFGMGKSLWIQDEKLAMLCVVLPAVWAGLGPGSLIYLAALKVIPNELYEAAELDGAGFLGKIRHVVFPSLKGLIIVQLIAAFIVAAQSSDFILIMTFGGPNEATRVADLMIFEKAYLYLNFGLATTMAWMLSLFLMGFTVLQIKYISRMEFKSVRED